jgi:hypothetical protein
MIYYYFPFAYFLSGVSAVAFEKNLIKIATKAKATA